MTTIKVSGIVLCTLGGLSCHCGSEQHASSRGEGEVLRAPPSRGTDVALGPVKHGAVLAELLDGAKRGGKTAVDYRVPSEDEVESYAAWVVGALGKSGDVPARPGFVVRPLSDQGELVALLEEPRQKRGTGAVILRRGSARPILLQIPHSYFDVGTLPLGVELFELLEARAMMVNTVHRYRATDGEKPPKGEHSTTDMAHAERSAYLALHDALVARRPELLTIQLHGFADDAVPGVDVILSGSKTRLDPRPIAERLRAALPDVQVRAYPHDVDKLGGTTNVEARTSRRRGSEFLHVEMSRSMRQRLGAEDGAAARRALARALLPLRRDVEPSWQSGAP